MTYRKAETAPAKDVAGSSSRGILTKLRKRHIIATLAAFIGGGWLLIEIVERLFVGHYKLPEEFIDLTVISVIGALLSTLVWRWFRSSEKRPGNVKPEVLLVPLIVLATLAIDLNLVFHVAGISGTGWLISIIALLLGLSWIIFRSWRWAAQAARRRKKDLANKSIVVLPFVNISPEPGQEYFCDGITEEIISDLSHIQKLRVVSRTSAMLLKGSPKPVREIARELRVRYVLEGSVRKAGDDLRITAQLIDARNDAHLWADNINGTMDDVFAMQEKISHSIVNTLKLQLMPAEEPPSTPGPAKSTQEEIPAPESSAPKGKAAKEKEIAGRKGRVRWRRAVFYVVDVIILAFIIYYAGLQLFSGRGEVIDSIAVLPFENVAADPNTESLCDGIAEAIINKLSQLSGLKTVICRSSVFAYKGKTVDPRKAGEELGVKAVLLTRLVRQGDRLIISPTLVRTSDSSQLWGERYDRKFEDIFAIEEDMATSIVQALRLKLTKQDQQVISERSINNAMAYELYLRANHEIRRYREDSLDRVVQDLQKGLEIIGPNPFIYSALASAYVQYVNIGEKQEDYLAKAEDYANKALDLDPNFSKAFIALGYLYEDRSRLEGIRYFKKALAVNPNEPYALRRLALIYLGCGKPRAALPLMESFKKTDPLNPDIHLLQGAAYLYEGRFAPALDEYRKLYQSDPESPNRQFLYARTLAYNKRLGEAFSIIDASAKATPTNVVTKLGLLLKYGILGDKDGARREMTSDFREACHRDNGWSYLVAEAFALMAEKKEALDWLENAVDRGYLNYPFVNEHDAFLENIRGEERFKKLMERVKYEWEHFEE